MAWINGQWVDEDELQGMLYSGVTPTLPSMIGLGTGWGQTDARGIFGTPTFNMWDSSSFNDDLGVLDQEALAGPTVNKFTPVSSDSAFSFYNPADLNKALNPDWNTDVGLPFAGGAGGNVGEMPAGGKLGAPTVGGINPLSVYATMGGGPAIYGASKLPVKALDFMNKPTGPGFWAGTQNNRWDTVGEVVDMALVLGKYVGIPTALGILGYDALTESPEELRQSILEDVQTTPFSSALDAATIGETTVPNQYGGYGIPSAIAVDQQGNPINLDSIDRPSRTGRTGRLNRSGAALDPSAINQALDTAYNESIGMGQVASHPGQGGYIGDVERTIGEHLAAQDERQQAMPAVTTSQALAVQNARQQAMPEAVAPAPTAPTVAAVAAQDRLAQMQADAAMRQRQLEATARDEARRAEQAQAASAAQAQAAQNAARAVLASAAGRDRGGPSQAEINAAIEVMSQVDTFGGGRLRGEEPMSAAEINVAGGMEFGGAGGMAGSGRGSSGRGGPGGRGR